MVVIISAASAESLEEVVAEQSRIRKEIQNLIRKSAWRGVDRMYVQLLQLERPEAMLTFTDHLAGATASRELGLIKETMERLGAAITLNPTAQEKEWLRFLRRKTGYIKVQGRFLTTDKLIIDQIPFAPDLQKAIEKAETILHEQGEFIGFLPRGSYQIGDTSFQVPMKLQSNAALKRQRALQPIALSAGLNGVFMSSGDDVGPSGFFAPGVLAGARYRHSMNKMWLQGNAFVGFYGSTNVQMFSTQVACFLGTEVGFGNIGLGGLYDFSGGRIYGLNAQSLDTICQNCSGPDILESESYHSGYATSFGPVVSYSFPVKDVFGIELQLGSRSDNFRWYTWGAVSSTMQLGQ